MRLLQNPISAEFRDWLSVGFSVTTAGSDRLNTIPNPIYNIKGVVVYESMSDKIGFSRLLHSVSINGQADQIAAAAAAALLDILRS